MITLSQHARSAKKHDAYAMAIRLLEGETLERADLESLVLYFAPSKTTAKEIREPLEWLKLFAGVADVRYYLNYLYSDGKDLYATNGHILAWAPTDKPAGFYDVKTLLPATVDAKYPDVSRVIPAKSGEPVRMDSLGYEVEQSEAKGREKVFQIRRYEGANYNAAYASIVERGGNAVIECTMAENSPLRGRTDCGQFVIMPCRR